MEFTEILKSCIMRFRCEGYFS